MADLTDDVLLTKTLCALLGDIPGWDWRESGSAYDGTEVAVMYGRILDQPDRAVAVQVYGATDYRDGVLTRRAQLRFRGPQHAITGADELATAAYTRLQGLSRVGGISRISRLSMAPLGADTNGREQRSDNYTITLDNPEA